MPVFEYCSAVLCFDVDTHLKLLDLEVNGACFLTGGMHECVLLYAHRRFVSELGKLYVIRCNPIHVLHGALPWPFVPVRCTRGAFVAQMILMRLLSAESCCTQDLYSTFQNLCGTILVTLNSILWD